MPRWDVTVGCKGAEAAGSGEQGYAALKGCMESEARTRAKLEQEWTTFPADDKGRCIRMAVSFAPNYTETAACLEMGRSSAYKAGEPVVTTKPKR